MIRSLAIGFITLAAVSQCFAQVGGGAAGYGQTQSGSAAAWQNERSKRNLGREELPPDSTSTFLSASVLVSMKADQYVAVFAISEEEQTPEECVRNMDRSAFQRQPCALRGSCALCVESCAMHARALRHGHRAYD